jgi:heat shock protein HslJ
MKITSILLAVAVVLSACASGKKEDAPAKSATAAPAETQSGRAGAPAGGGLLKTLEAHRWTLESATDAGNRRDDILSPGAGRAFVFTFSGSAMNISGGCNSLRGSYEINAEGKLQVGSMASTMMACEPALMKADTALSALLAKPMRIDVLPGPQPQLRLVAASNETLTLTGQMTPEARYGPATLVFLEVAARQVKCNAPPGGETMCLQVRERQFDQQGLAVGTPGAFQPFFGNIEGFKHTPGVRTVLRVKRFQRSPVPGDASTSLYVLDLVIESETVTQ